METMDDYKEELEASLNHHQDNGSLSDEEAAVWELLQDMMDNNKILTVKVGGIVPSGVIAYVEGIRGFIPASHLCLDYVEDTTPWLGKTLDVKIITVDPELKKLVLSGKEVEKERKEAKKQEQIASLVPGSILHGVVESLKPYGAFIALDNGLSGLVHISQISIKRINKPSEVLKVGQPVTVKLLHTNDGKISLSMRALEEETVQAEEESAAHEYVSSERASTSLGDLLSKFKLEE
jgi:small subunit ribosomal protein S1